MGFSNSMRRQNGLTEAELQVRLQEQAEDYIAKNERLLEQWEKRDGMGLGNGKLAEMYTKDKYRALSLVRILENTERDLMNKLKEYQTSSYMGITPQEVVKVFRFAYGDSVTPDLFNVWGMESIKDTFYKIETKYSSTKRGATAGQTIYENYNDGKYPTSYNDLVITGNGSTTVFSGTLSVYPALAFSFKVFGPTGLVGNDDGNGALNITGVSAGTINYATGAYSITFSTAPANGVEYTVDYASDAEDESLFSNVGSVSLNLVPYDFRGKFHSMEASWSRMTEEVSQSKLGRSARQDLLDGISDVIKKSQDEFYTTRAIRLASWTTAETHDANWSNAGSDSDYAQTQAIIKKLERARGKAYASLGRFPARTNLLVGYQAKAYLRGVEGYQVNANKDEVGFFKDGDVQGYGVYVAPPSVVGANDIYLIGRGKEAMSTDAVLSIGIYKGDLASDELEFSNFKNQVGFGQISDYTVGNSKMITKLSIVNND